MIVEVKLEQEEFKKYLQVLKILEEENKTLKSENQFLKFALKCKIEKTK